MRPCQACGGEREAVVVQEDPRSVEVVVKVVCRKCGKEEGPYRL